MDVRVADEILYAKAHEETGQVVEMLVDALRHVGPAPNARKTTKK